MKKLLVLFFAVFVVLASSCANSKNSDGLQNASSEEQMNIVITIGTKKFSATLESNAATKALVQQFPLTLNMSELNGNEYYKYLDGSLPTASKNPRTISAGDIKLYGSNCIVIFYKSFSTGYSYTPLGKIDDPSSLEEALKSSGGEVTLELAQAAAN